MKALGEARVVHDARLVGLRFGLVREVNGGVLNFHLAHVLLGHHVHEGAVIKRLDLVLRNDGRDEKIEGGDGKQHHHVVVDQRLFG